MTEQTIPAGSTKKMEIPLKKIGIVLIFLLVVTLLQTLIGTYFIVSMSCYSQLEFIDKAQNLSKIIKLLDLDEVLLQKIDTLSQKVKKAK